MNKYIQSLFFALQLIFRLQKKLLYLYIVRIFIQIFNAYVFVFFPGSLITHIENKQYIYAVHIVAIFMVVQLLVAIAQDLVNSRIQMSENTYNDSIDILIHEKLTSLRFEQIATADGRNEYELARTCRNNGSIVVIISSIYSIISSIVVIFSVVLILPTFSWWFYCLIALFVLIRAFGQYRSVRNTYYMTNEKVLSDRKLEYFRDGLTWRKYAKEIRAYSLQSFILDKLSKNIDEVYKITERYNKQEIKKTWWIHLIDLFENVLVYSYNIILVFASHLSAGQFTINISAIQQFIGSVNNIFSQGISISEQFIYLDAFYSFLTKPSAYEGEEALPEGDDIIEFENVCFSYPGQEQFVLNNINTKIQLGEKVSIVGQNGAGKTTFLLLLMGLYKPTKGRITYNGVDIERISPHEYAKLFAPVMQDYHIFSFTIFNNLVFSDNLKNPLINEKVASILQAMGLYEKVCSLPNGIETYITQTFCENGIELSGGESQKLAIARMLYRDSPIMILDEPTSALSPQSEFEIYKKFDEITEGHTVIYISHRLASCTLSERILVFDNGRLVENGSHAELIKTNGKYSELYNSQLELYGLKNTGENS